jgi:predicted transcriptional regulator
MRRQFVGNVIGKRQQEAYDFIVFAARWLSVGDVARELGVTYQAAYQCVRRLEEFGLVSREWGWGRYRNRSLLAVV